MRKMEALASLIAGQIETDSASIMQLLNDENYIRKYGFSKATIPGLFIPNTYNIYWNTNAGEFIERMKKEYDNFWNTYRMNITKKLNLTRNDISTLASIVEEETNKTDEMPRVAGVYINRLRKRMKLQADPTLKYALNDWSVRRLLNRDKTINSPYNTYKHYGIPPGPIRIPSIQAIDAVINFEQHHYIYFCAKPGSTGYHNFASTHREHQRNAELYQAWLNNRRTYR
jgi:UPF0755 protein